MYWKNLQFAKLEAMKLLSVITIEFVYIILTISSLYSTTEHQISFIIYDATRYSPFLTPASISSEKCERFGNGVDH